MSLREHPTLANATNGWLAQTNRGAAPLSPYTSVAAADDREQRVCRQGRDDRYAWPSDSRVIEVAASLGTAGAHATGDCACSESAAQQTWRAVAIADIQACRDWARHDCFGSRGCSGRASAMPRKGASAPTDADDRFDDSRHPHRTLASNGNQASVIWAGVGGGRRAFRTTCAFCECARQHVGAGWTGGALASAQIRAPHLRWP